MWSNRDWVGSLFPSSANSQSYLKHYSSFFSSVEGNTTFYALPSREVVASWLEQTRPGFRFCFKLPRTISHDHGLRHSGLELKKFFHRLQPLSSRLGSFMIQLPASFAPDKLGDLKSFLEQLPAEFNYSVEVRHEGFFQRDDNERKLNQLLQDHTVDRVSFDSRALFSRPAITAAEIDGKKKKPQLPVHAVSTGSQPIVRFIGCSDMAHNQQYLLPWVKKIEQWVAQGITPTVFIHTPDNQRAPEQAAAFHDLLEHLPGWRPLPKLASSQQTSFF